MSFSMKESTIRKFYTFIRDTVSKYNGVPFRVMRDDRGVKFVDAATVADDRLHISDGNTKTGPIGSFNLPPYYSCNHMCECYGGNCYACSGRHEQDYIQLAYTENFRYFLKHSTEEFVAAINAAIKAKKYKHFRWFSSGDIVSPRFFKAMVEIAKENPDVRFWGYTKKYNIVNKFIAENGREAIPENLKILFSHWMNKDGSYFPMENPYNLPTSEFIPYGREDLVDSMTHICPCSNPDVFEHCTDCSNPCWKINDGEKMALLEHSTKATKKRDAFIRTAHKKIAESAKKTA